MELCWPILYAPKKTPSMHTTARIVTTLGVGRPDMVTSNARSVSKRPKPRTTSRKAPSERYGGWPSSMLFAVAFCLSTFTLFWTLLASLWRIPNLSDSGIVLIALRSQKTSLQACYRSINFATLLASFPCPLESSTWADLHSVRLYGDISIL